MEAPALNGGMSNGDAATKLPIRPHQNGNGVQQQPREFQGGPAANHQAELPGNYAVQPPSGAQPGTEPNSDETKDEGHGILSSFNSTELSRFVQKKKGPPGGLDATALPNVPQGYTVRFTFRSAANLPPSDINTASSDPYLTATLKVPSVKRHKDDPDLIHRTPTMQRTTDPVWQDEWVVANVPETGFTLKCRLYDEDAADTDDRLGNVTIKVPRIFDQWDGFPPPGREFKASKRPISKRAFVIKAISSVFQSDVHMTPRLTVSIEVLGRSEPPYAQMCTIGPACWTKHYSPLIGRLAGTKVDAPDGTPGKGEKEKPQKYEYVTRISI